MEPQPEVVAAAHAVRSWVLAQRATWSGSALRWSGDGVTVANEQPAAVLADLEQVLQTMDPGWSGPEAPAGFGPGDVEPIAEPEPPDLAPLLRMAEPTASIYVEAPRRLITTGLIARAAVVLASAGIVGSGGFVAWKRYGAAAPRVVAAVFEANAEPDRAPVGAAPGAATSTRRTGRLQVTSDPAGARVSIDGRQSGVTPLELDDLAVGTHAVALESAEGSVRRTIRIAAGRTEVLSESIYPGWIHVSAPFEVTVMDGATGVQLDADSRALMKPGTHTLRVENRRLAFSESRQIVIEPGGIAEVSIASPLSTLTVTGPAGAEVFVDGEKIGTVPLAAAPVKVGTRNVMVVDRSGATQHRSLSITMAPATLEFTP
jgi:hypothetical protein